MPSKSHTLYNVFLLKSVASSMWWSRALLQKINKVNNVEVNIKTHHVIYGMLRDFNLEGHNIIIASTLGYKLR